jgi:hypothetical protein
MRQAILGLMIVLGSTALTGARAGEVICPSPQVAALSAGFGLARASPTAAEWEANRRGLARALAGQRTAHDRFMIGEDIGPPFITLQIATPPGDRRTELTRRMGEDQFALTSSQVVNARARWAEGLSAPQLNALSAVNSAALCRINRDNVAWLKSDFKAHGWYAISTMGAQANHDAWILIQHADADPAFQSDVLLAMAKLLKTYDTSASSYAYLFDRVRVGAKRPQRYGTQGHCTGVGAWEPRPIENPKTVDDRRMSVGLPSIGGYQANIGRLCTTASP